MRRGVLGLGFTTDETNKVAKVVPEGQAASDGLLQVGDVVVAIDGNEIHEGVPLATFVTEEQRKSYEFIVKRRSPELLATIALCPDNHPIWEAVASSQPLQLYAIRADATNGLGLDVSETNVLNRLVPGGTAERTGADWRAGDVLLSVNGEQLAGRSLIDVLVSLDPQWRPYYDFVVLRVGHSEAGGEHNGTSEAVAAQSATRPSSVPPLQLPTACAATAGSTIATLLCITVRRGPGGLGISVDEKNNTVRTIFEGGQAAMDCLLEVGDKVVAIDGNPLYSLPAGAVLAAECSRFEFVVRRQCSAFIDTIKRCPAEHPVRLSLAAGRPLRVHGVKAIAAANHLDLGLTDANNALGLVLTDANVLEQLVPGGAAEVTGGDWNAGDLLLAVDGVGLAGRPLADVLEPGKETYTISVLRECDAAEAKMVATMEEWEARMETAATEPAASALEAAMRAATAKDEAVARAAKEAAAAMPKEEMLGKLAGAAEACLWAALEEEGDKVVRSPTRLLAARRESDEQPAEGGPASHRANEANEMNEANAAGDANEVAEAGEARGSQAGQEVEAAKTVQRATRKRAKRTAEAQASKKVWAAREAPLAAEQKAIRETPGTKVTREAKAAKDTMDAKGMAEAEAALEAARARVEADEAGAFQATLEPKAAAKDDVGMQAQKAEGQQLLLRELAVITASAADAVTSLSLGKGLSLTSAADDENSGHTCQTPQLSAVLFDGTNVLHTPRTPTATAAPSATPRTVQSVHTAGPAATPVPEQFLSTVTSLPPDVAAAVTSAFDQIGASPLATPLPPSRILLAAEATLPSAPLPSPEDSRTTSRNERRSLTRSNSYSHRGRSHRSQLSTILDHTFAAADTVHQHDTMVPSSDNAPTSSRRLAASGFALEQADFQPSSESESTAACLPVLSSCPAAAAADPQPQQEQPSPPPVPPISTVAANLISTMAANLSLNIQLLSHGADSTQVDKSGCGLLDRPHEPSHSARGHLPSGRLLSARGQSPLSARLGSARPSSSRLSSARGSSSSRCLHSESPLADYSKDAPCSSRRRLNSARGSGCLGAEARGTPDTEPQSDPPFFSTAVGAGQHESSVDHTPLAPSPSPPTVAHSSSSPLLRQPTLRASQAVRSRPPDDEVPLAAKVGMAAQLAREASRPVRLSRRTIADGYTPRSVRKAELSKLMEVLHHTTDEPPSPPNTSPLVASLVGYYQTFDEQLQPATGKQSATDKQSAVDKWPVTDKQPFTDKQAANDIEGAQSAWWDAAADFVSAGRTAVATAIAGAATALDEEAVLRVVHGPSLTVSQPVAGIPDPQS